VYLLLASALDPEATSLPIHAAFVPFLEQLTLGWSGLGGGAPPSVPAGRPINLPPDADSVVAPDGTVTRVDGDSPYLATRAGVHTVLSGSGSRSVGVKVPEAESDPRTLDPHIAARRLGRPEARVATSDDRWLDALFGARHGASGVPLLLALVVALAIAEVIVATSGSGSAAADGGRT
jgi:hypothetical protein